MTADVEKQGIPSVNGPAVRDRRIRTETVGSVGQPAAPDGGWGYMVLLGTMLSFVMLGGMARAGTLVFQQLYEMFRKSAAETAWVMAIQGSLKFMSSPIASVLCNRYGIRLTVIIGGILAVSGVIACAFPPSLIYVYVTYGVLTGFGSSLVVTGCFIVVGQYFDKKRAKANSMATTGGALGGIILAPVLTILFDTYGYKGTMLLIGGLLLHFFVSAALFRPLAKNKAITIELKEENPNDLEEHQRMLGRVDNEVVSTRNRNTSALETTDPLQSAFGSAASLSHDPKNPEEPGNGKLERKNWCQRYLNVELLKESGFLCFSFLMLCISVSFSVVATFFAGLARERGVTTGQLATLIAVTSCVDLVARLSSGVMFDLKMVRQRRLVLFNLLGFLYATTLTLIPLTTDFTSLLIASSVRTLFSASFHSQHTTILSDIVGKKRLASAIGLSRFFMGVGNLTGPSTGGWLRDISANYNYTHYFAGGAAMLGVFIMTSYSAYRRFSARKKQNDSG